MQAVFSGNLIEAASAGDTQAIEQLLLEYQPSIVRFARKFCATPEDVEDAVQETLWVIYRKIGTLRQPGAFVGWIFRIVRHHCYRLLNIKYRENDGVDVSRLDMLEHDAADNGELVLLLRQDVVAAIAALPPDFRQVLILRDMENLSAPEVCEITGLTVETVKSRLHRARRLLRLALQHWNE